MIRSPPSDAAAPSAARSISRQLTLRYVLSLGAVAVLAVAGRVVVQHSLNQQDSDARVINLAGRQRMLCQRLAKAALWPSSPEQRASLAGSLKALTRVHNGLQKGDPQLGLPPLSSPAVIAYFTELSPYFDGLSEGVRRLLEPSLDAEALSLARAQVHLHEKRFLETMDEIVFRFDAEAGRRVEQLKQIETALLLLTLMVLLFEAMFVFRPSVTTLEGSLTSLIRTRDDLARIESDLQATMRAIPDGVARLMSDGRLKLLKPMDDGPLALDARVGSVLNLDSLPAALGTALAESQSEARLSNALSSRRAVVDADKETSAYEVRVAPSLGTGNVAMIRDITEQRQLEAEVLDANERAQSRVGRDLHDGLCQKLAGLALLARTRADDPDRDEFVRLLDEGVQEARQLALGLSPTTLTNLGLSGALEEVIRQIETISDIDCSLVIPDESIELSEESALQVYRIAQEAAANAAKHAGATRLWIRLLKTDGGICLEVQDNGRGIPPPERRTPGLGLDTMSYRARILNGDLSVMIANSGGTIVRSRIPIGKSKVLQPSKLAGT